MNKYFNLLSTIADEYHINRQAEEDSLSYKARIIYSYLGQAGYSSLWDITEDGTDTGSIMNFKRRMKDILYSFMTMYPQLEEVFTDITALCNEIYSVMLDTGCFYHESRILSAPAYSCSHYGGCVYVRGQPLSCKVRISGIGCYVREDVSDVREVPFKEMFGLSESTIKDFWEYLTHNAIWTKHDGNITLEYLRTEAPFNVGYWKSNADKNIISLARSKSFYEYIYFLYKVEGNHIYVSQLPDWLNYRTAAASCLASIGTLPPVTYHYDTDTVYIRLGYLLPLPEMNLVTLYSWPSRYSKFPCGFNRIMCKDIFAGIKSSLEENGYTFKEV